MTGTLLASNFDGLFRFYFLVVSPLCLLLMAGVFAMLSAGYRKELRSPKMIGGTFLVVLSLACLVCLAINF